MYCMLRVVFIACLYAGIHIKRIESKMTPVISYNSASAGSIAIIEVDLDAMFITLENTGKKDITMNNWKLERNVDGKLTNTYSFPTGYTFGAMQKIKIFAKGASEVEGNDLVDEDSWTLGAQITTSLLNEINEVRASYIIKTTYN